MQNTKFRRIYAAFAILSISVATVLVAYLGLGSNLGAERASAALDSSTGSYTYKTVLPQLRSIGKVLNQEVFIASSNADSYQVATPKALSKVNFLASNLPTSTAVSLCIIAENEQREIVNPIICHSQNLDTDSGIEWSKTLDMQILVEPENNYYCQLEVRSPSQANGLFQKVSTAAASCQLEFITVDSASNLVTSVPVNALAVLSQGPDLLSGLGNGLTLNKSARLVGFDFDVAFDASLPEQEVYDLCVGQGQSARCAANKSYFQGTARSDVSTTSADLQIEASEPLEVTCSTQSGRAGLCRAFLYFQTSVEQVSASARVNLNPRVENISKYCREELYSYANHPAMIKFTSENEKITRCEAILSTSN